MNDIVYFGAAASFSAQQRHEHVTWGNVTDIKFSFKTRFKNAAFCLSNYPISSISVNSRHFFQQHGFLSHLIKA